VPGTASARSHILDTPFWGESISSRCKLPDTVLEIEGSSRSDLSILENSPCVSSPGEEREQRRPPGLALALAGAVVGRRLARVAGAR
jgi:hypothetical protein